MIRIDEIYSSIFGPWFRQQHPGTRVYFCDPPGTADPNDIFNYPSDPAQDNDYVFFHDQEPADTTIFREIFDRIVERTIEFDPRPCGHIVVSERGSRVDQVCQEYHWQPHYYFYHAWASLDWYRGYDRTFLIEPVERRQPTRAFFSPNRIVGGHRDHRVVFLYHIFRNNLQDNHISAPRICPHEGVDIASIAQKYTHVYPDIVEVLTQAGLPRYFPGETTQVMSSYRLTNFDQAADSLVYAVTETVYFGDRTHLTEKTFRPIALAMPFVLIAPAHSLKYLREYGFQTFDGIFDESYDDETDDFRRLERVTDLLREFNDSSPAELQELHRKCQPIVEYNRNHFYSGGLVKILDQELQQMLADIQTSARLPFIGPIPRWSKQYRAAQSNL